MSNSGLSWLRSVHPRGETRAVRTHRRSSLRARARSEPLRRRRATRLARLGAHPRRREGKRVSVESVDVAIVGYGPVGQALALQLGRAGHRVAVFERFQEAYRMPRAVHIDHEIMRLLQDLGLADELADEMVAVSEYRWFGADGEPLMTLGQPAPSASGWEPDYLFFQPALEATLDRAVAAQPSVTVQRGWAAEKLETATNGARLTVRRVQEDGPQGNTREIEARWVVGADGANSFVRESLGIDRRN